MEAAGTFSAQNIPKGKGKKQERVYSTPPYRSSRIVI
jgi:hypothetical protein